MLISRHYLLLLLSTLISVTTKPMDDVTKNFLDNTRLAYDALIKATQNGDTFTVMQLIKKQPAIINSTDKEDNRLITIASLNEREKLVKNLVQAGARIDSFEYAKISWVLEKIPQSAQAKRILSFLTFIQSPEFLNYDVYRSAEAGQRPTSRIDSMMINHNAACLSSSTVPFYEAVWYNDHLMIKPILETIGHKMSKKILLHAAGIATMGCNNQYLALYILFSQDNPLNEIFFKKIMDAQ